MWAINKGNYDSKNDFETTIMGVADGGMPGWRFIHACRVTRVLTWREIRSGKNGGVIRSGCIGVYRVAKFKSLHYTIGLDVLLKWPCMKCGLLK